MAVNLSGRSFLKLLDFEPEEIRYLLDVAKEFKKLKLTNTPHKYLEGKEAYLVFIVNSNHLDDVPQVLDFFLSYK